MKYLLWSKLYKQWYREPGDGLTLDIDKAGRFTKEDAESLQREVGFEVLKKADNGSNLVLIIPVPANLLKGEKQ